MVLLGHSELQVASDVEVTHIVPDYLLAIWTWHPSLR